MNLIHSYNTRVFVGAPADLVNVRMQNDCKLPKEQRRNYKHAIDGIVRIIREEGGSKLFNGRYRTNKSEV